MTLYTFSNKKENGEIEFFVSTNKTHIERAHKNCRKDKTNITTSRQSVWDDIVITIDGNITDVENI